MKAYGVVGVIKKGAVNVVLIIKFIQCHQHLQTHLGCSPYHQLYKPFDLYTIPHYSAVQGTYHPYTVGKLRVGELQSKDSDFMKMTGKFVAEIKYSSSVGGPYQPKLDFGQVLEFFRMCLPPLNSLTQLLKRNFRVQKRGCSRQKYPKVALFLYLACFSGFQRFKAR